VEKEGIRRGFSLAAMDEGRRGPSPRIIPKMWGSGMSRASSMLSLLLLLLRRRRRRRA
jgi:hypothetical protein